MSEHDNDSAYLKDKQKVKNKKLTRVIIIFAAIVVLAGVLGFLFIPVRIDYGDMYDGISAVNEGGVIYFDISITTGSGKYSGGMSAPVAYDYENGISYRYYYLAFEATRWDKLFNKGVKRIEDFAVTVDGKEIHTGSESDEVQKLTEEEYRENPYLMDYRYIRVYYVNSDNSCVLVWENESMPEIIERTGAEVNPDPMSYRLSGRQRR